MIDMKDYSDKLGQVVRGEITLEEWKAYCFEILAELLEENKDVMVRLKNR